MTTSAIKLNDKKFNINFVSYPTTFEKNEKEGIAYEQTESPARVVQDSVSNMAFHQALIQTF